MIIVIIDCFFTLLAKIARQQRYLFSCLDGARKHRKQQVFFISL